MAKSETTKILEAVIFEYFFLQRSMRCALEVDIGNMKRVDFCAYKGNEFTGIEIKVSVSDFKSENGHNLVFDKNYYATTEAVYEKVKDLIPSHVGVYVLDKVDCYKWEKNKFDSKNRYTLKLVKRCKKIPMTANKERVKENMITALNSSVRRLLDIYRYEM